MNLFEWILNIICFLFPFFCGNPCVDDDGAPRCQNGSGCRVQSYWANTYECTSCNPGWQGQHCDDPSGPLTTKSLPTMIRMGSSAAEQSAILQQTYDSCATLAIDLTKATWHLVNATIERNVEGYFRNKWWWGGRDNEIFPLVGSNGDVSFSPPPPPSPPQPKDSFETNIQKEGVDEADFLKSDGVKAFAAYGSEIIEYNVATNSVTSRTALPKTTALQENYCGRSSVSIDGMLWIRERNSLIVFAKEYTYYCGPWYYEGFSTSSENHQPIVQDYGSSIIHIYDSSTMELRSTQTLQGDYESARSNGENVYVVTRNYINTWSLLRFLYPNDRQVFGSFGFANENDYRERARENVIPYIGAFVEQLVSEIDDCSTMQQIALWQNTADVVLGFSHQLESLVHVHAFAVPSAGPASIVTRSMFLPSSNSNVFASQNYLVIAGEAYNVNFMTENGDGVEDKTAEEQSIVVVYQLQGPSIAKVMFGQVPGYALNQFSMDQVRQLKNPPGIDTAEADYLRIATCTRQRWWWGAGTWESTEESLCEINVLEITDGLPIVGTVDNLGKPTERIYAVRFQDELGFVVTFRETDPFYTINMADPNNPFKAGELAIPGFSNYLHPVGEKYILGVGQGVNQVTGATVGLQISLFDVSNLSSPLRVQNFVENSPSYSAAQYDHRAFRYLEDIEYLILPFTSWSDQNNGVDGFRAYKIDAQNGIKPHLTVEHEEGNFYAYGCWSRNGYLEPRSILVNGILRTWKAHTIIANRFFVSDTNPEHFVGRINLDEKLPPENCTPDYFVGGEL